MTTNFPKMERLSVDAPFFVSPHGTGCSRYVSTLVAKGSIITTWQQSQDDFSQPLVVNAVEMDEVEQILN